MFGGDGEIVADNTDAPALVAALPEPIAGRTALVLGAGGSARAAVWALLDAGAGEVRIWNRTPERARRLSAELGGDRGATPAPADLLVNCTSVGLDGSPTLAGLPIDADRPDSLRWCGRLRLRARRHRPGAGGPRAGVPAVDGLELLVGQGALSFEQFTGVPASVEAMRAAVGLPNL